MPELPIIDCDADPFVPEGWKVLSHKKDGQLVWDLNKVGMLTPACQNGIIPPVANEVEGALKDEPVLNANVLDFLIAHPECAAVEKLSWMDEEDSGGSVLFWGTVYENENGERIVRCLTLEDGVLGWGIIRLDSDGLLWDANPAAVYTKESLAA